MSSRVFFPSLFCPFLGFKKNLGAFKPKGRPFEPKHSPPWGSAGAPRRHSCTEGATSRSLHYLFCFIGNQSYTQHDKLMRRTLFRLLISGINACNGGNLTRLKRVGKRRNEKRGGRGGGIRGGEGRNKTTTNKQRREPRSPEST